MARERMNPPPASAPPAPAGDPPPLPPSTVIQVDKRSDSKDGDNEVTQFSSESEEDLKKLFTMMDVDNSGEINFDEFCLALSFLQGRDVSKSAVKVIMGEVDSNNDGQVSFDEFKSFFAKIEGLKEAESNLIETKKKNKVKSSILICYFAAFFMGFGISLFLYLSQFGSEDIGAVAVNNDASQDGRTNSSETIQPMVEQESRTRMIGRLGIYLCGAMLCVGVCIGVVFPVLSMRCAGWTDRLDDTWNNLRSSIRGSDKMDYDNMPRIKKYKPSPESKQFSYRPTGNKKFNDSLDKIEDHLAGRRSGGQSSRNQRTMSMQQQNTSDDEIKKINDPTGSIAVKSMMLQMREGERRKSLQFNDENENQLPENHVIPPYKPGDYIVAQMHQCSSMMNPAVVRQFNPVSMSRSYTGSYRVKPKEEAAKTWGSDNWNQLPKQLIPGKRMLPGEEQERKKQLAIEAGAHPHAVTMPEGMRRGSKIRARNGGNNSDTETDSDDDEEYKPQLAITM